MSRDKFVFRNGTFVKDNTRKSALLLPAHLRALPGELVTQDIEEDGKIHEIDPDYIQAEIKQAYDQKLHVAATMKSLDIHTQMRKRRAQEAIEPVPMTDKAPLSQPRIDAVRLGVMKQFVDNAYACMNEKRDYAQYLRVHHLWFPTNNINDRELRQGNPPSDYGRPKHMRGFDIVIDICEWPPKIKALLQEYGIEIPSINDAMKRAAQEADLDQSRAARLDR